MKSLTLLALLLLGLASYAFKVNNTFEDPRLDARQVKRFDPVSQRISTTGIHKWVAPSSTDQRGPCPGLNALANHGYLPRNGIASALEITVAVNTVYGMGDDLGAFLAFYSTVLDGNGSSLSIGGKDSRVGLPILGPFKGLTGSHNNFETDASPTRGDLYLDGDNWGVLPKNFKRLYEMQLNVTDEESNYDLPLVTDFHASRLAESISENPRFFSSVFSGIVVGQAGYIFQPRLMANHSIDYPEGRLSKTVLKSFFGVTGEYPDFVYNRGHERIPDIYYRRPNDYYMTDFVSNVISGAQKYPQFLSVGGNMGKPNTFTGIDLKNLTGGAYSTTSLLDPKNLICFVYLILAGYLPFDLGYTCPKLASIDYDSVFAPYPGYP
ncbi:heme-thiolate peroxidase [Pleurotus djamor]|nr:heme-thiolate peroxidase [Pleurotus djamor]